MLLISGESHSKLQLKLVVFMLPIMTVSIGVMLLNLGVVGRPLTPSLLDL